MIPENIKNRIKKLLDFRDSTAKAGSIAEAENASARIQEILFKYNLDMNDIERDRGGTEKSYIMKEIELDSLQSKTDGRFVQQLFSSIAETNLCSCIIRTYRNIDYETQKIIKTKMIVILGIETNVEIVEFMVLQLVPRIKFMARTSYKTYYGHEKKNAFFRGYCMGAVSGIYKKLRDGLEVHLSDEQTNAMVLVKNAELEKFKKNKFPDLVDGRKSKLSGIGGAQLGYRDGQKMNIHKGIKSNALNQSLLE